MPYTMPSHLLSSSIWSVGLLLGGRSEGPHLWSVGRAWAAELPWICVDFPKRLALGEGCAALTPSGPFPTLFPHFSLLPTVELPRHTSCFDSAQFVIVVGKLLEPGAEVLDRN